MPQRERPWLVCLPLRLRRARVDKRGGGGGGGVVGLRAAPVALGLPGARGASTAFAGARFGGAAGVGEGAGLTLARFGFCGVTAVSTSAGRGCAAKGTGRGGMEAGAGVRGGGPAAAIT
jgi:hypothetical protein